MANYTGHITPDSAVASTVWSVNLDDFTFTAWANASSVMAATLPTGGARSHPGPVPVRAGAVSATLAPAYHDDYYHRIHIVPNPLALGNLTGDRQESVEVWNAYRATKTLTAITAANASGLTLTGPAAAPTDFAAYESRLYTLDAALDGPAVIDATYTFDFPDHDPVLQVTGQRVVPWIFAPNWQVPPVERLAWLTDVLPRRDGSEQRRALRSLPRQGLRFRSTISGAQARRMDTLLAGWQDKAFLIPLWMDGATVTADVAADALVVPVDATAGARFVANSLAVAVVDGAALVVEVSAVAAQQLTLSNPCPGAIAANTQIYPARVARLQDSQPMHQPTSSIRDALLTWEIVETLDDTTAADSAGSYRGLSVLDESPNWRPGLDSQYQRNLQRLDNQTGLRDWTDVTGVPVLTRHHLWTRANRSETAALRAWLYARQGRLTPIWVPTFTPDMVPTATLVQGETNLRIQHIDYHLYLQGLPGRKHIRIRLTDGTLLYRMINSATEVDATTENLVVDSAWPQDITTDEVAMISYLQLFRLQADAVEFLWHSSRITEVAGVFWGLTDDD